MNFKKINLAILGSTGSIGQSTLEVARAFPEKIKIVSLAAGRNVELLARQIAEFTPELVSVLGPTEAAELLKLLKTQAVQRMPEIYHGSSGAIMAASASGVDVVLGAIVGAAGLAPSLAAVKKGLKLALANKESLVLGGELIMPLAAQTGAQILPVDSEHSAIFQALGGGPAPNLRRIILTASGGPFRGRKLADLAQVTAAEALKHPKWAMGPKISCDSATMMNKGLEIIEAHHLFQMPYEKIEVLVHPQSIVHSLIEYIDGSQLAQLGPTDMRLAISYALSFPERWPLIAAAAGEKMSAYQPLELGQFSPLTFEAPDEKNFPALRLAQEAGRIGGLAPAILNGANEEAVAQFIKGAISFTRISQLVDAALNRLPGGPINEVEEALAKDQEARALVRSLI